MYTETTEIDVGYCLTDPSGGFAFQPPRTVFSTRERPLGTRAIQNCPAVNAIERHLVELPSPIGIRLTLEDEDDGPALGVIEQGTFVEPEKIGEMIALEPPERWRHPKRPVLQITLPFFFVTDAPCMLNQLPPFLAPGMRRWPGTMAVGRFPLTIWPQTLTFAFEWDRPDQELALKQGEPLCYFLFEFNKPDARPRLLEAALTPELEEYRKGMQGVRHITSDIDAVWAEAERRRPARLLVPLAEAEGAAGA
ncbi:MAG: hypothetical protein ACFBSD_05690 [Paracoccaceae bacterium]